MTMRAILVFSVTLFFGASAYAVAINCVNEGNGVVRIDYDASSEKILPIAFALDLTVDGGATITKVYDYKTGESSAASPGFGIFPASMQLDANGSVTDWGSPIVSGGAGASSVTLGMAARYYDKKNAPRVRGTLCRILVETNGAPMVNVNVIPNTNMGGIVLEDATIAKLTSPGTILGIRVNKCTVIAGNNPTTDAIKISGFIDVTTDKFTIPGSVEVTISSANMVSPCVETFPIDATTFKSGQYECTRDEKPLKTSFAFDSKTFKFSFTAKNESLKGLSSPVHIDIKIGSYAAAADIDETIVNGAKRPIPIKLMMGVKNSLRIDKVTTSRSARPASDKLTVKGGFAVEVTDTNLVNVPLAVTLGTQKFTIPINSFRAGKDKFTCSKIVLSDGSLASSSFNFRTCAFTVTIKKTKIAAVAGDVNLRLAFAGFNEFELVGIK
jgi:hypothetical protein